MEFREKVAMLDNQVIMCLILMFLEICSVYLLILYKIEETKCIDKGTYIISITLYILYRKLLEKD